jgi:Gamma-glutamyl cyclotransferase, AIG2-like
VALNVGIKERERRVEVFFYGLFMDEELLRGKGLEPEGGEIAAIDGFALRVGQRAALVPTLGAKVYGLVFSLTRSELDRLHSESSVQAHKRQVALAQLASGGVVTALCYNLRQPPSPTERNPEYAVKLRAVSQKVGLAAEYIASLQYCFVGDLTGEVLCTRLRQRDAGRPRPSGKAGGPYVRALVASPSGRSSLADR